MVESKAATTTQSDEFTICAGAAEVRRASEWLAATCSLRDVPPTQVERLEICLNEVLANILTYGGSAASAAPIRLRLEVRYMAEAAEARVTVSDAGLAFNPLTVATPPRPKTLAEAREGGLGLVMIRRCSDWLDYRYADGHNHFSFGARWSQAPGL